MPTLCMNDVEAALHDLRHDVASYFHLLRQPYEALARREPGAAIQHPRDVATSRWTYPFRELAAGILRAGGEVWPLYRVDRRQRQIEDFDHDYHAGRYGGVPAGEWLTMLSEFERLVLEDVQAAQRALSSWRQLQLPVLSVEGEKEIWTPADAARHMGVGTPALRRSIREGRAGPWRREGSRWRIRREEFLKHFSENASESGVAAKPTRSEATSALEILNRRPTRRRAVRR